MAVIGEDGLISETHPLSDALLGCIPTEVGLWRQQVVLSCIDASQQYLAVGSVQGYVWVVDLQASRLLREFSEFKGSSITVVKLNPVRDCLAYGTSSGYVRVERISRAVSTKWRVQEKSHTPVSALEWRANGDDLYCGFTSGRLIQFRLHFVDGVMSHVPLPENFGSHVIQLSSGVDTLLVSTLERALMLNTETHKLDQVGRKDRKPGPYGGCLVQNGGKAYISRPGLRMWAADNDGKVTHTVAFKEALSTRHLPAVSLQTWSSLTAHYNKTWQFTQLHPWVADQFIVTHFEDTLFVLDQEDGEIAGVLSLEHPITSIATTGAHVYLLCAKSPKAILRITIHPSYTRGKLLLPSRLSFHISGYKVGSGSPLFGSREEGLDEISEKREDKEQQEEQNETVVSTKRETRDDAPAEAERDTGEVGDREREGDTPDSGPTMVAGQGDNSTEREQEQGGGEGLEGKGSEDSGEPALREATALHSFIDDSGMSRDDATKSHDDTTKSHDNITKSHDDDTTKTHDDKTTPHPPSTEASSTPTPPSSSTTPQDPPKTTISIPLPITLVKEDLKEIKERLKPKFGKLANLLTPHSSSSTTQSQTTSPATVAADKENDESGPPAGELLVQRGAQDVRQPSPTPLVPPAPPRLDQGEQERRLRMAQVEDDDAVVVVAQSPRPHHHKKKKKRKHKKLSSATSSKSVSLEQLTDIADDQSLYDDTPTPPPPSSSATPSLPLVFTEEQEAKLAAFERKQRAELETKRERVVSIIPEEHDDNGTSPVPPTGVTSLDDLPPATDNTLYDATTGLSSAKDTVSSPPVIPEPSCEAAAASLASEREEVDHPLPPPLSHGDIERECESGQPLPVQQIDSTVVSTSEELTNKRATSEELSNQRMTGEELTDQHHPPLEAAIDYTSMSPELHPQLGGGWRGSSSNGRSTTKSPFEEEVISDNPLYHDSEELSVGTGQVVDNKTHTTTAARREVTTDRGGRERVRPKEFSKRLQKRRSLSVTLQDAAFDPLQSDEDVFAHSRYSSSPEVPPPMMSQTPQIPLGVWGDRQREHQQPHTARDTGREALLEGSDSSHDSASDMLDASQVEPDFYKLCGALVKESNKPSEKDPLMAGLRGIHTLPSHSKRAELLAEAQEGEDDEMEEEVMTKDEKELSSQNADIWVPIPHPSRYHLQCVCLSDQLLWVVDSRSNVFCTSTTSRGKDWQNIKRSMQIISSSPSGTVVWGIHRQNAYVRLGIGLNQAGSTWRNNTKGTPLAHRVKHLAVDENGVWVVTGDGRILFRKDVSESNPEGKVWQEVGYGVAFTYVTCCQGIVWALTASGKVYIRDGITPSAPSGKRWYESKAPKLAGVSITKSGVVWCINHDGSIGFRCGVSRSKPNGKGPWWEVTINALTHPSSPYNSLWQVMSSEGSHVLASVSSLVTSLPGLSQNKLVSVSASSNAGVVVLEGGNKLHACWRSATGYHYTSVSKNDLFQFISWTQFAAGSTALWLVRDDGDLYCLAPGEKLKRVECSSKVELIAASPMCMWVVSKDMVWSRQGMTKEYPDGISFDYIELSTQLHERKLRQVACGKRSVWAIDTIGVPHFRFGVHAREPGTGMAPAWVPVEDNPKPLNRIAVNPDDWLVWACDENHNVYVRVGVTHNFPVGRKWEPVPTQQVREICASNDKVYALTPNGELLCRYGITRSNVQGNYWRRMPGDYDQITTGVLGDLWVLDRKGNVWKQESKVLSVSEQPASGQEDFEHSMVVDQSWEVV